MLDGLSLATALMGLFPSVWQLLYGLATSKFSRRLLKQQKVHSSNEAVTPDDVLLEDLIKELDCWIDLIVSHSDDVVAAFADCPVTDFVDSMVKDLKSIVKDAQTTLKLRNSSKKRTNVAGLNQRALKIISSFFEFMFNEVKNMGILEHNSANHYQLSGNNPKRNNVTNINIFNFYIGDCNASTEQQLQIAAELINQIMKLNANDTNIIQCSVKSVELDSNEGRFVGTEDPSALIPAIPGRPARRIRRKPSFKQVLPVTEESEHMTLYSNEQRERSAEKERRAASSSYLASTSDYFSEERPIDPRAPSLMLHKARNRDKSMMIEYSYTSPIAAINDSNKCRMSHSLSLNRIDNYDKTYLGYTLSYTSFESGVGALMGDKNIFDLCQSIPQISGAEGKLHFYTECEVLKAGTVLGIGLVVAGSSDEYRYFRKDKMVGWYKKSCGFDGCVGTVNCNKSLMLDYRSGCTPGWPAGGVPYFAEADRLGMGVRLSNDGSEAEVFYTKNGAVLPGYVDLGKMWSSDGIWGGAPAWSKVDIRLVVALAEPMSTIRLTFFENIPTL